MRKKMKRVAKKNTRKTKQKRVKIGPTAIKRIPFDAPPLLPIESSPVNEKPNDKEKDIKDVLASLVEMVHNLQEVSENIKERDLLAKYAGDLVLLALITIGDLTHLTKAEKALMTYDRIIDGLTKKLKEEQEKESADKFSWKQTRKELLERCLAGSRT